MHAVVILGAGASKEAGGPLMYDFLDRAEDLRREGARVSHGDFDRVFEGIGRLQRAQSKAVLDIDNIESVMAAFEMAGLFGSLGDLSQDEVEKLSDAAAVLVADTVEESIQFNLLPHTVQAPASYGALGNLIKGLRDGGHTVSILTFNYDLCADVLLNDLRYIPDYALSDGASTGGIELLKLHGSLNWSADTSNVIQPLTVHDFLLRSRRHLFEEEKQGAFRIREHLPAFLKGSTGKPIVVPPTWAKTAYYKSLKNVWRRAASSLHKAESIFVFGYSLPASDQFFRLLYALGTVGPARIKRFWVGDPSPTTAARFTEILGQSAAARFRHFEDVFSVAARKVFIELSREGVRLDKPG